MAASCTRPASGWDVWCPELLLVDACPAGKDSQSRHPHDTHVSRAEPRGQIVSILERTETDTAHNWSKEKTYMKKAKAMKGQPTTLSPDSLDAILRQRFGGAVNIRGIRYQILYSLFKTIESIQTSAGAEVRLEGIEDLDVIGLSVDSQYIQVKTADQTWNFAKLKDPLKNFLEVMRKDPTARFVLIVNFPLPTTEEIGKLAKFRSLSEPDKSKIKSKFNQYCRDVGARASEADALLNTLVIETVPLDRLWQDLRQQIASAFGVGSEAVDTYVRVLTDQFTQWAEARKTVTKSDLNSVRDTIGRSLSRESEYQAYGKSLIDRLVWTVDDRAEDYLAGKQTRPGHIASGIDVKRGRWLKQIADALDKIKICVIKSSSGQGKSSLAFRYAFEKWKPHAVFLLNTVTTEQDAEQICLFLKCQRSLAIVPFLIIDNANWQKRHWGRVAQECVAHGGQVIVTVRTEDWVRFSEPSRITYDVVEPSLGHDEAKDIYTAFRKNRQLHAGIGSAEHAYELLTEPKLLLEYVYLITHGQMLSERLSEQIRQFSAPDDDSTKAVMLRRAMLAAIAGIPLTVDAMCQGLSPRQDLQHILESLIGEYLVIDGEYIYGLHWVRSRHLVRLLHATYPNAAATAVNMLSLIAQEHVPVFLAGMCEIPEFDWQTFTAKILAQYRSALPIMLVRILEGLFQVGERLFFDQNRMQFDQYVQEYGIDASVFITSYLLPLADVRNSIRVGLDIARPGAYEDLATLCSRMNQDVRGLSLCHKFLSNIETPTKERLTADYRSTGLLYDWCRVTQISIDSWPKIAADVLLHTTTIFELPLNSFCAFLQGMFTHDEQLYHHWFTERHRTILSYLRLHTDTIGLQLVGNDAYVRYIPQYASNESPHKQTMERLNYLRSALPFVEIYHAQAQWLFPSGVEPTYDESTKAIPRNNLQCVSDGSKNGVLSRIVDRAYRPDSYYMFQKIWHAFREIAMQGTDVFVNFAIKMLNSGAGQPSQDPTILINTFQRLSTQSLALPLLPHQAADTFEKEFECARKFETHLTNSLRQFIESLLPDNADKAQNRQLCHHNATQALVILPAFHDRFAKMYRISSDYFDGTSLNASERRIYADWAAVLLVYSDWNGSPVSKIRELIHAREVARRQSELSKLHYLLAILEQGRGMRFVYPRDSIEIDSLRYMPLGFEVSDPTTHDELALILAALSQERELTYFYYLVPLWNGARYIEGGYRFSVDTLHKLATEEKFFWESFVPGPIPSEVLALLGDIPLRVPRTVESANAISALRGELEVLQNHLDALTVLRESVEHFDRLLYMQHQKELRVRLTQFIDARGTISSKYAEAIILHASVWSEIGERIEALTSALA